MKYKLLAILVFVLGFAVSAWALEWDVGGFETTPPGTESIGLSDNRQREHKNEVRERAEAEHCWGTGGKATTSCNIGSNNEDNGRHRMGSARSFLQNGEPVALEVDDYHNTGGAEVGLLDDGRTWFDQNDHYRAWVYDETLTDFELITADDEILAGSYNLMYNGSFEAAFGDGDAAGACAVVGACVTADLAGTGWDVLLTPGITFTDPSADLLYGDGYSINVQALGAGLEGITQTLGVLPNGATYKIIYRNDNDGVEECQVTAEGAGAGIIYDSGAFTDGAWTTYEGEFTTTALEDIVISLISVNANDVCSWDHINVYRIDDPEDDRPEISQPGLVVLFDDNTGAAQTIIGAGYGGITGLDDLTVVTPGPGYVITVVGMIIFENSPDLTPVSCDARITQNAAAVSFGAWQWRSDGHGAVRGTVSMQYVNNAPVPGATYTYALEAIDSLPVKCRTDAANDPSASLMVRVEPTR